MLSHMVLAWAASVPARSRNRVAPVSFEEEVRRNREREVRRLEAALRRQLPARG
mgnify:CR=1 FL=1